MKNKTHLLARGFVTGKAFQVRKAELVKDYCLKAIPWKKRDKNSVFSNSLVIPHHWCVSTGVKASSTTRSFVVTSSVSAWQLCFCLRDAFITPSLHNVPCVFKHCVYHDRFSSLLWDGSTIPSVTLKNSSFSRLNTHVSLSEVRNTSRQPTWERPCCPVRRADCGAYWTTGSGRPGWAAWRCLAGCGSGYCHWCAAPWGGWVSTMSCSGSSPALHPNTDIKSNMRTKAQCGFSRLI